MSAHVADLKAQHSRALAKADEILAAAERAHRPLTVNESSTVKQCTAQAADLKSEIDRVETAQRFRSLRAEIPAPVQLTTGSGPQEEKMIPKRLSAEYVAAFFPNVLKGRITNPSLSAALQEGTNSMGGYAVPSLVADDQYVPLAPSDSTIRKLAKVIPTVCDLKFPGTATLPTATVKAEGGTVTPTSSSMNQFTLTANTVWTQTDVSLEFFQDVVTFDAFYGEDILSAISVLEEQYFISGTGIGQPQGLLGNVGAGVTGQTADSSGNLLSIDSTFNVLSTLKDRYHKNASFVMSRASGIELRLAQKQSALWEGVFTRDADGTERLHGYPVFYSASMPAIAAGVTPVLFGDFRAAYIIGDRGGSAVYLKAIDQDATKALQALVPTIGYRRVDGKVRRSEAVQGITLHT